MASRKDAQRGGYRLDPTTGQVDQFTELVGAYSYGDLTGFGLQQVGYTAVDLQ